MSGTGRWLIGHRHGPRIDPSFRCAIDTFLAAHPASRVYRRTSVGRLVIDMPEADRRELALANPGLVIEADEPLLEPGMPGLPPVAPTGGGHTLPVSVTDLTNAQGIAGVSVYGIGRSGVAYHAVTDATGQAVLQTYEPVYRHLIAAAPHTYWSQVVSAESAGPLAVRLKPLLSMGAYDWGRRLCGFQDLDLVWRGSGIRIAVIGSGIDARQPALRPEGGYNSLDEDDPAAWQTDETGCGTHAAGIVAGVEEAIGVYGGAPAAKLYAVKVVPEGRLSNLVEAVEWCILNRMDVVHIGVAASEPSHVLAGVLHDAATRGIVCVAPAGDAATHVAYPATLPSVIAVSAVGRQYTFPDDSGHALHQSRLTDPKRQIFAARFSNFGAEIEVCAPGVAILSTVPGGYAAWDGTAAASAFVAALCALILEACPGCRTGDARSTEIVRAILRDNATDLGMPLPIQGRGLIAAVRAFAVPRPGRSEWWKGFG